VIGLAGAVTEGRVGFGRRSGTIDLLHHILELTELRFQPVEERAGLHRFPLFDGACQIGDQLLLLRDELGRYARDAGSNPAVGTRTVQTVELFGGLLESFRQRGDELFSLCQLRFQRLHAFLHCP
jgi:hypothetical protein